MIVCSSEDGGAAAKRDFKRVVNLLELVTNSSADCSETCALFMDELAAVIAQGHIDVKVEEWINDHVVNTFQDDFIVDVEPEVTSRGRVSLAPRFALDKSEENSIAVDVFRLLLPDRATPAPKSRRQVVNRCVLR